MIRKQFVIYRNLTTEGRRLLGKPFDTEEEAVDELERIATASPGWVGAKTAPNTWTPFLYEIVPVYRNIPGGS